MELRRPSPKELPSYIKALRQGWSPNTMRPEARLDELDAIEADPSGFLASLDDADASGPPIVLPDGSTVERLPGLRRWMWDGDFCGSTSLRWVPGTVELPAHVLGHVGFSVVEWKQRRGYATRALALTLLEAAAVGLPLIELTTDVDNIASQRVIENNGGALVERFEKPPPFGGGLALRYRISTTPK